MIKKKWSKGIISIALAATLALGQFGMVNWNKEYVVAAEEQTNLFKDGDLGDDATDNLWNDGIWKFGDGDTTWNIVGDSAIKYDEWAANPHDGTSKGLGIYYGNSDGTISMYQEIGELNAGTYTITGYFKETNGKKTTVQAYAENKSNVCNDQGEVTKEFQQLSFTFTLDKDVSNYKVGFLISSEQGAWVTIDSLSLVGKMPETEGTVTEEKKEEVKETETQENDSTEKTQEGYKLTVQASVTEIEVGQTVDLTATLTNNGDEVTSLSDSGVKLWWYLDVWNDYSNGSSEAEIEKDDKGKTLTTKLTPTKAGIYYVASKLEDGNGEISCVHTTITVKEKNITDSQETVTPVKNEYLNITKVSNLSNDFVMGMDISSVVSEFASGVTYKDYDGNTINNVTDFCKFLASNGITHIRVRVWNNPYDSDGNGYGGGNNDVTKAKEIADACREAGLKMLVDFHCSDFWADPGKQQAPKEWANFSLEQKKTAVAKFIGASLNTIDSQKNVVAMVQVGNETTNGFVGETDTTNMCSLFSAGVDAVHDYNSDVKAVIHVTNPEKGNVTTWAKNLKKNNVNYDILATSYYPYWHGTLANLANEFKKVKDTYGKDVMVAETSYAYTLDDSDGHDNTVRVGNNDKDGNTTEPFTVQGQATAIRNLIDTVNSAGGLGVFYWEPAWITVGDTTGLSGDDYSNKVEENKEKWQKNGSGWASSYAGEYDSKDAGQWYGGSAVDNEAMFYANGTPTDALRVWKYVRTGAVSTTVQVDKIINVSGYAYLNGKCVLPDTVEVNYNTGTENEKVTWDTSKVDTSKLGTYEVKGVVTFSKEVTGRKYRGQTAAIITDTVTVSAANLITDADDASFEKWDNYSVTEDSGIDDELYKGDSKTGTGCVHWWKASASEGTVTYNKSITLEPGKYTFEYSAQGADTSVKAVVLDQNKKELFSGDEVNLAGWKNWKTPSVSFALDKETTIYVQLEIKFKAGGWGTADDMYLYQTKVADTKGEVKEPETEDTKGEVKEPETEDTKGEVKEPTTDDKKEQPENPVAEEKNDKTDATTKEEQKEETNQSVPKDEATVIESATDKTITIADTTAVLPIGTKLTTKKVTDQTVLKDVKEVMNKNLSNVKDTVVYELNLSNGTTQLHQLDGKVQVTMEAPFELASGEKVEVYRVDSDKLVKCDAEIKDGKLLFTTDHFSTFIFVKTTTEQKTQINSETKTETTQVTTAQVTETATTTAAPETGDSYAVILYMLAVLAGAACMVVTTSRKKKS